MYEDSEWPDCSAFYPVIHSNVIGELFTTDIVEMCNLI